MGSGRSAIFVEVERPALRGAQEARVGAIGAGERPVA
jgi:hypothetical protein